MSICYNCKSEIDLGESDDWTTPKNEVYIHSFRDFTTIPPTTIQRFFCSIKCLIQSKAKEVKVLNKILEEEI